MQNQWNDFEKYLITRIDTLEDKISKVDRKVTALRSKVATIATFIGTILGTAAHFIAKKMGV